MVDKEIQPLNRYCDIMAFKDTRVQLKPRTEETKNLLAATYINACFVDVRNSYLLVNSCFLVAVEVRR